MTHEGDTINCDKKAGCWKNLLAYWYLRQGKSKPSLSLVSLAVKAFEAEELNQGLFSATTRYLVTKKYEAYF